MSINDAIIQVENLSKVYRINQKEPGVVGAIKGLFWQRHREVKALDQISFELRTGEIVGYIGVNGAGKSTTIKLLTGILLPSGGKVSVLGRNPHRQRVANARDIGVVFGQRSQLWWDLALIESLNLIAKIYEIDQGHYSRLLARYSEALDLKELLKVPIRNMSLGQKMRAELAATLIHEPKIVYLDEPTIGLDLIVKERIREFIREQNRQNGTTVILTTHDLGDIEELCKRVIIIDKGQVIFDGPIELIKRRFGKYRTITFEIDPRGSLTDPADLKFSTLQLPPGAEIVPAHEKTSLVLRFDRTLTTASQVSASVMNQMEIKDFSLKEPDLASVVKQIYEGALSEAMVEDGSSKEPSLGDNSLREARA